MPSHFRLFSLPPELRCEVYKHYSIVEGGYFYVCSADGFSGRLFQADGSPIETSLMSTCKEVNREMEGMVFRFNTITFSTTTSTQLRRRAADMEFAIREIHKIQEALCAVAGSAMTDQVQAQLSILYPQFIPLLSKLRNGTWLPWEIRFSYLDSISYGQSPSLYHEFCKDLLRALLRKCPGSVGRLEQYWIWADKWAAFAYGTGPSPGGVARCELATWNFPSDVDLSSLQTWITVFGAWVRTISGEKMPNRNADRFNYRFSAAATAINFLQSLPIKDRLQLRSVVLNEDRESVALPESHGQGLIQFCKANVALRIERRVDLWRNILQHDPVNAKSLRGAWSYQSLNSNRIIWNISQWMVEASRLVATGMPEASFKWVIDAGSSPQQATEMFKSAIQQGASWQDAWTQDQQKSFVVQYGSTRKLPGLMFTEFPHILRDVTAERSIISCNFDVGEAWSFESQFPLHEYWTEEKWEEEWAAFSATTWQTKPPLPEWQTLVRENLLQNDGSERRRRKPGKRKWRDYSYQLPT
ncbi:C6 transcription factor [Colletotrichum asianum]|uniref:C6 transcription factor n=1 Tax=Colletotrichum asianum TaxID=702518 RepID=A0A8H3WRS0_9PEZI|nr:C6 transcription factor [Colletotrichum asianum]